MIVHRVYLMPYYAERSARIVRYALVLSSRLSYPCPCPCLAYHLRLLREWAPYHWYTVECINATGCSCLRLLCPYHRKGRTSFRLPYQTLRHSWIRWSWNVAEVWQVSGSGGRWKTRIGVRIIFNPVHSVKASYCIVAVSGAYFNGSERSPWAHTHHIQLWRPDKIV